MSSEAFRAAVQGALDEWFSVNWPEVFVHWENGPEPDAEKVSVWADVRLRWYSAGPVTTGLRPRGRDRGAISVTAYCREGSGTQVADRIIDGLRERLRSRRLGGGVIDFPQRADGSAVPGWCRAGMLAPFYLDSP